LEGKRVVPSSIVMTGQTSKPKSGRELYVFGLILSCYGPETLAAWGLSLLFDEICGMNIAFTVIGPHSCRHMASRMAGNLSNLKSKDKKYVGPDKKKYMY